MAPSPRPLALVAALLAVAAAGAPPAPPSEVWPQPANLTTGGTPVMLPPTFSIACAASSLCPDPLTAAFARYLAIVFAAGPPAPSTGRASPLRDDGATLPSLIVTIDAAAPLSLSVDDEAYSLLVPDDGSPARLRGATQWGALRGLESFAQLVMWQGPDDPDNAYVVTNAPVYIDDAPRFQFRGVLIDTSFNFLTVARIRDVLDSMAIMKANVLHWHVTDDPSWPMASTLFPNFTAPGNGGPYASVATYSPADQAALGAYAWERGVLILLELDVPGHCAAWGAGSPALVTACDGGKTLINPVGDVGQAGTVYDVLPRLAAEWRDRLGPAAGGLPWLHVGGDEVDDYSCWDASPDVQAWAKSLNISGDAASVRTAFTGRLQDAVAASAGAPRAMFWEEAFAGGFGVRPGAIVTPWVHPAALGAAAAAGHDVIAYVGYYLDQWVPPARTDVEVWLANVSYAFVDSWRLFYAFDPVTSGGVAPRDAGRVLGGVASAWGDNVDSSAGATGMLYPRGLAIGEKLWSPAAATAVDGAADPRLDAIGARLEHARCKLAQRGIAASPLGVAGDFGFCWSPAWAPATPPGGGGDAITVSSGAMAAIVLGAGAASVALAACVAFRAPLAKAVFGGAGDAGADGGGSVAAAAAGASGGGGGGGGGRFVALDQLRGLTMISMLFVNLYYGQPDGPLPKFFSHGITYVSGPDLVEPAFHFCVGYALRLALPRRLADAARGGATSWWGARWVVFARLLRTRVAGLIIVSMFLTEGWGQFDSFAGIGGFRAWLTQLVQGIRPYHTLTHIAFITVWTFLPMTMGWRARAALLVLTAALHTLLHATFYFDWIGIYGLDEGGYFGFTGWAIEALTGALAYDVVQWAVAPPAAAPAGVGDGDRGDSTVTWAAPRTGAGGGSGAAAAAATAVPLLAAAGDGATKPVSARRARSRLCRAAWFLTGGGAGLMLLAYALSCLGAVRAANPVCYDGTQVYFWGGFGPHADCGGVPTYAGGALVAPPLYYPDPATNVVTMWTMTQRAGSTTYHLFTAGTSLVLLALAIAACEVGVRAPAWWGPRAAAAGARIAGVHTAADADAAGDDADDAASDGSDGSGGRLRLRWHVLEVLGENALAVYVLSDGIGDRVGDMLPPDSPAWYFVLWGEGLYIGVTYLVALYLRQHKLFVRL